MPSSPPTGSLCCQFSVAHGEPARSRPARGCLVSCRPRARSLAGWAVASQHRHGAQGAPSTLGIGELVSSLGFPHCSNPTAFCILSPGCLLRDTKAGNCIMGSTGRPPPRWLMGGAAHCHGLAFDCGFSPCALPVRPWCVRVHVHVCEQRTGCSPGQWQEGAEPDPIRVQSCSGIRTFTLTREDAQMAACVWG